MKRSAFDADGVKNTVGAGDAFFGAFLDGLAAGGNLLIVMARAQLFDALKIRTSGGGEGFPDSAALAEECRRRGI